MQKRMLTLLAVMLMSCVSMAAQQAAQPLTFWYTYTVRPGKEDEFLNLVKTVGQPVRDKLMADGVILAWGIEVPLLRHPDDSNRWIWYMVNDWAGVEKVQAAMQAQLAKVAAEEEKAAADGRKLGRKPGMTTAERSREVFDESKTRDYLTRDLVSGYGSDTPPAGSLPFARYGFVKVKPGKGNAYRTAWEKYNKPVYDKLIADKVILAYGLATEELKTDGNFTHYSWFGCKDLAAMEKVRDAFNADRARRSEEERAAIADLFAGLTDPDSARGYATRALIFKVPGQK